ncbi:MAG: hypothetical protein IT376_15825 [Polyangiaceae bacterium]|nr:hypothetical protein [Polyangiaceae bacterium]
MGGAYRDAAGALTTRIAAARERLDRSRAEVLPVWLPFLAVDPSALYRAEATLAEAEAAPPTRELAARVEQDAEAVEHLVRDQAALLRAVGEAPLLDRWLDRDRISALSFPALQARAWAAFARATRALAAEVRYARHGAYCYEARFRIDGAAYAYGCNAFVDDDGESESFLATTLPEAVEPFSLAPQSYLDDLARWVRGRPAEAEIGDPELDGRFLMYGEAHALRRYLCGAARPPLLELCNTDVPRVEVASGCAVVAWRFEPEAGSLAAARRFLAALHREVG